MKYFFKTHFPTLSTICEQLAEVGRFELHRFSRFVEQISRYIKQHPTVLLVVVLTLHLYVSSYFVLSRQGFAEADKGGMEDGFYFVPPEDTDEWRFRNYTLVRIYYPLIVIDNFIGTGRLVAHEPLWGLS